MATSRGRTSNMATEGRPSLDELKKLRVVDLRAKLSSLGLQTSGRKAELIARLDSYFESVEPPDLQPAKASKPELFDSAGVEEELKKEIIELKKTLKHKNEELGQANLRIGQLTRCVKEVEPPDLQRAKASKPELFDSAGVEEELKKEIIELKKTLKHKNEELGQANLRIGQLTRCVKEVEPPDLQPAKASKPELFDSAGVEEELKKEIIELKKTLKHKNKELGQANLRIGQLTRCVKEANAREADWEEKEKEFEENMDALNEDIDTLKRALQENVEPRYLQRPKAFKSELFDSAAVMEKLLQNGNEFRELKKNMKHKDERLSFFEEQNGRLMKLLELADVRVKSSNCKMEQATAELQRKEKEFEENTASLKNDIDTLERENLELNKRLNANVAAVVAGRAEAVNITVVNKDSPVILAQVESLKIALKHLKQENIRLKSRQLKKQLDDIPIIHVPPRIQPPSEPSEEQGEDSVPSLNSVTRETNKLLEKLQKMSLPKVIDISNREPGSVPALSKLTPADHLVEQTAILRDLKRQKEELHDKIQKLIAAEYHGETSPTFSKEQLNSLPEIYVPPRIQPRSESSEEQPKDSVPSLNAVTRETNELLEKLQMMSAFPKVVDLSRRKPGSVPALSKLTPAHHLVEQTAILRDLKRQKEELHGKIQKLRAAEYPGGTPQSSFAQFVSPTFSKVLQENVKTPLLGRITIPVPSGTEPNKFSVTLKPQEFRTLHNLLANYMLDAEDV